MGIYADNDKYNEQKSKLDLVNRQDVIDALGEEPLIWHDGDDEIVERNQWLRDKAAIESLPSAELKTGVWIRKNDGLFFWWECSECGREAMANKFSYREERSAFCPFCGARMEDVDK